jgi:hypothetical protein
MIDSKFFKNHELVSFWVYLLLKANHTESFETSMGIKVCRGQLLTGRKTISQETGLSESKIERFLKKLEIEHQIEQQKTTKYRVISITNWDKYQSTEHQTEQQVNNNRTTSEQQVNTDKNDNNIKNVKNTISAEAEGLFDEFWKAYPKRLGDNPKKKARESFLRAIKINDPREIINAAVLLSKSLNGEVSRFTPQASTWLNQERFKDEICNEYTVKVEEDKEKLNLLKGVI